MTTSAGLTDYRQQCRDMVDALRLMLGMCPLYCESSEGEREVSREENKRRKR